MKNPLRVSTAALALSAAACAGNAKTLEEALASLVAAECSFAQASLDSGFKAAFLGVLAEDGTVYQPGPVNGREVISANPDPPITLSWYPEVAHIASSGDLGFTSGPYTVSSKNPEETRRGAGHYTSVWRRRPTGAWELVVDLGTPHPAPKRKIPDWKPPSGSTPIAPDVSNDERYHRRAALLRRDAELGKPVEGETFLDALSRFARTDARIYRPGNEPFEGLASFGANPRFAAEVSKGEPTSVEISNAGDWGFSLGKSTMVSGDSVFHAHYLRLWRRSESDGEWTLFLDTIAPLPPPVA